MSTARRFLLAVAFAIGSAASANAQHESPEVAVIRFAAAHVIVRAGVGVVALDTSIAPRGGPPVELQSDRQAQFAAMIEVLKPAKVGPLVELLTCPRSRKNCDFSGVDVVVNLGQPLVRGDSAFIPVVTTRPGARGRVFQLHETEVYTRRDGAWSFAKNYVRSTT